MQLPPRVWTATQNQPHNFGAKDSPPIPRLVISPGRSQVVPLTYLYQKSTRPLSTKDGGTLRTLLKAYFRRIGSGAPNGNTLPSCYWRRPMLPT